MKVILDLKILQQRETKEFKRKNSTDGANMNDRIITLVTKKYYTEKFLQNENSTLVLQPVKINTKVEKTNSNLKRKRFRKDKGNYEKQHLTNLPSNIIAKNQLGSESHPADPIHSYDYNPMLNTKVYDVIFPDSIIQQSPVNIIAEILYENSDEDAHTYYQYMDKRLGNSSFEALVSWPT